MKITEKNRRNNSKSKEKESDRNQHKHYKTILNLILRKFFLNASFIFMLEFYSPVCLFVVGNVVNRVLLNIYFIQMKMNTKKKMKRKMYVS